LETSLKVLFIASSNSNRFGIAPFIKAQGESLIKEGVNVQYFSVTGKGFRGYIHSAIKLHKYLKNKKFDIIHSHYTLCGWIAILSMPRIPLVLSLMGSDVYGEYIGVNKIALKSRYLTLLTYLIQPFTNVLISKSQNIANYVFLKKKSHIIPNGVSLDQFKPLRKNEIRKELHMDPDSKYILFLGNPNDKRKNFKLIKEAINQIRTENILLLAPYPIEHELISKYLYASDVFVLTAFMEGSPNVIKEAMVCNCPIVATNVGDVEWVINKTPGCYIADFDPIDFSNKILQALKFRKQYHETKGQERIIELGLDSESIARKLISVYNSVK
jgi:teichuronic acid biosynthesis glycosyltransferase TuaC